MERTLDRLKHVDLRSLNFRVQLPDTVAYRPRSFTWRPGPTVLDQGRQGACVGFGWSGELAARPLTAKNITNESARELYAEAKKIDEWEGEDYEGTSVLAGAKVAMRQGHITSYRWCLSVDDLVQSLGYLGPVVIGVDWYTGMFETDPNGFIRPTGQIEGGHCVMLNRIALKRNKDRTIDPVASYVEGVNSWGPDWGVHGHFKIALVDVAILFSGGDFAVPLGRKAVA